MAIKRCKRSFAARINGAPQVVPEGALVEDGDPILEGRGDLFEDVETFVSGRRVQDTSADPVRGVEQATADPGEKRAPRRAKSPTVQKKEQ